MCTDSVRQSDTIWNQRSGSGRFRTRDISRRRAHLCSATDPDRRCCRRRANAIKALAAPHEEQEKEEEKAEEEDVEWCRWLPGFAVGGDALTSVKDFPAVQAGAVSGGHAVSSVVFVVVVWAVAAAVTAHGDVLRRKRKQRFSIITRVLQRATTIFLRTVGLLRLSQVFRAVSTWCSTQWTQTFPFLHPDESSHPSAHRAHVKVNCVVCYTQLAQRDLHFREVTRCKCLQFKMKIHDTSAIIKMKTVR